MVRLVERLLPWCSFACIVQALPRFSWDRVPLYAHCENVTGPLSDEAAELFAKKTSFVTLEKKHNFHTPPNAAHAEQKIIAEGKRLKAINPDLEVIMYHGLDLSLWFYDVGAWFEEHPQYLLNCNDRNYIMGSGNVFDQHHVYDLAQPAAVEAWVEAGVKAVETGHIDGIFVDGVLEDTRGDWVGNPVLNFMGYILGPAHCNHSHASAWLQGVNSSQKLLSQKLGPDRLIFANMGPPREGNNAVMIESFKPNNHYLQRLQQLADAKKYVAVHLYEADYNSSLAAFLIGARPNQYFSIHGGAFEPAWTCNQLFNNWHWEYEEALGTPEEAVNNSFVFTRSFSSGTRVFLDIRNVTLAQPPSCIHWSSGKKTGNACSGHPEASSLVI